MALRFVHTADWHLGMRFRGFRNEQEKELRLARIEVLERILGVAEQHSADAILCAGDLFDTPTPEPEWWQPLVALFSKPRWKKRPIFLLPGNHDPLQPGSIWEPSHEFRRRLPEHVKVVDRDDFEVPLNEHAVLFARPCRSQAGQKDLALELPGRVSGDERIRIGLVHGSTFDMKDHQTNFPIDKEAAVKRGFDYLAIGDTHSFRWVPPDAKVPTIYPGTPEPTSFGEDDPGNVAVVFVTRRRKVQVEKERVARWSWDARSVSNMDELRELTQEDLAQCVLKLSVQMAVSAAELDEARTILQQLAGTDAERPRVGILQLDDSGLELDPTNLAEFFEKMPEPIREAAKQLQESMAVEPDVARRALYHLYRLTKKVA